MNGGGSEGEAEEGREERGQEDVEDAETVENWGEVLLGVMLVICVD